MIFFFKKLVSHLLCLPVPMMVLIAVGMVLTRQGQRAVVGRVFVWLGLLLLLVGSLPPVADALLAPLEDRYPPYTGQGEGVDFVVVLGGGHTSSEQLPLSSHLNAASLTRLVEGMHIQRRHPGSRLILSGYRFKEPLANGEVMARVAEGLGLSRQEIIVEPNPRDTKDEARLIGARLGDRPFVLVTSASHMGRAVALFQAQGCQPLPAPTYFRRKPGNHTSWWPSAGAMAHVNVALHEYLGLAWARMRGQL